MCTSTFCEHLNVLYIFDQTDLYRLEVRLELYGANARLIVSSPCLSLSHPPTPPPSRWPGLTTFIPHRQVLRSHQFTPHRQVLARWRRLCEALLSSSSLAGQKQPSLLSRPCLKCRRYTGRFALNMKIKSSIIICGHSRCADRDVRSLNTTIIEGPIERHKLRLASRETGDRLTGT